MDLQKAHDRSFRNKSCIEKSTMVGCFFCLEQYPAATIVEYVRRDDTALCPHCGIDSCIGDASGIELSEAFLRAMQEHWFNKRDMWVLE